MPKAELPKEEQTPAREIMAARQAAARAELKPFNIYAYQIPNNPTEAQITKAVADLSATPDWLTVTVTTKRQPGPDPKTGALSHDHPIMQAEKQVHINAMRYAYHLLKESPIKHFPAMMEGAIYNPKSGTWRAFGKNEYFQTVETRATNDMLAWGVYNDKAINDVRKFLHRYTFDESFGKRSPFDDPEHPELVAFSNGTYNILTNSMQPNSPDNYMLNAHEYTVDPAKNKAPETEKLLTAMLGDAAITFEEFVGYMFYRSHAPFQELLWLSGSGGEGKSTLLKDVVGPMLGKDNFGAQNPQDLADPNKRFESAMLYGMEANLVPDVADGYMRDTSMIKRLTGGDVISAEFKGISNFHYVNYSKQLYAANTMPTFTDISGGFTARVMVIKLINGDVRHQPRRREFWGQFNMNAIKQERAAFAMRCMQLFAKALARGTFTKPESVVQASQEWIDANDHLGEFIAEGFLVDVGNELYFVQAPDFHRNFKQWCAENGYSDKTGPGKIKVRMGMKGFKQKAKKIKGATARCYMGLKPNDTFHF